MNFVSGKYIPFFFFSFSVPIQRILYEYACVLKKEDPPEVDGKTWETATGKFHARSTNIRNDDDWQ